MPKLPLSSQEFIQEMNIQPSTSAPVHKDELTTDDLMQMVPVAAMTESTSGADTAMVVGGSTISFDKTLSVQQRDDVSNSLLFAQYGANARFDRENQTREWYQCFRDILENLGWIIAGFTFSGEQNNESNFTMDKQILSVFSKAVSAAMIGNPLPILEATITALANLDEDSPQLSVFESHSNEGGNGNFQMSTAMNINGQVTMSMGAFYFKADKKEKKFLFFKWKKKTLNFYASLQQVAFNESVYASVRDVVADKLKDFVGSKVDIPLSAK